MKSKKYDSRINKIEVKTEQKCQEKGWFNPEKKKKSADRTNTKVELNGNLSL
jgi:hypothetical protein